MKSVTVLTMMNHPEQGMLSDQKGRVIMYGRTGSPEASQASGK